MNINKRSIGKDYEKIAGDYLASCGYEILEYNYYTRTGEIDIVAKDGEYLVFVEVKYRKNSAKGTPLEAISIQKQKSICQSAMFYMKKNGLTQSPVRFDVVGILGNEVQVLQNAFDFIV